ncbi:hypothetical protein JQ607_25240 [Bradyrhizobium liaoningense]|uniref:hypothetical protein n=1 Tax=Bradyrhizobium liaoningense TaxID=43992 RepID=UPI001BAAE061|nr:hypothetical protein [Bradyrhizobium liaoningense]
MARRSFDRIRRPLTLGRNPASRRGPLHRAGYRFRLYKPKLPGRPDVLFPGRRKAVFIQGCFWYGARLRKGATTQIQCGILGSKNPSKSEPRRARSPGACGSRLVGAVSMGVRTKRYTVAQEATCGLS